MCYKPVQISPLSRSLSFILSLSFCIVCPLLIDFLSISLSVSCHPQVYGNPQTDDLPVAGIQSPLWAEKGFAFGLRLQAWICLLLIEASASLVITRHFISDSQLDAFLNRDPEIRLWMTVALQCPSSSVFKPLSLPQNNSNLPINPFSVWRGDVL